MPDVKPTEPGGIFRVARFSRREFLKRVGISVGGATIAAAALSAACNRPGSTTGTDTRATTSPPPVSSSPAPPVSTSPPPVSTAPTSVAPTSAPPPTTASLTPYVYVPPATAPPLIEVPGTECKVATDRTYSPEHLWVKSLPDNLVVLGITTTMVKMLYEPYSLDLPFVGNTIKGGDTIGTIEGYKMMADLIAPVSGQVTQVNEYLVQQGKQGQGGYIAAINTDPYNSGWMFVVRLSRPDELQALLSAQKYRDLVAPK